MKKFNFAIVGATGLVGREMLRVLSEFDFNIDNLRLFATENSAGTKLKFADKTFTVETVTKGCFADIDIALFSAGSKASKKIAPIAAKEGAIVIDNSNAFRMDNLVPLVIPEINPKDLHNIPKKIIANPNCSTIQMLMALFPIYKNFGIKKIIVSTYQAVSGTGKKAVEELINQTKDILENKEPTVDVYPHQIAFNALPQIDVFEDNGFTVEEMKMLRETRKILHNTDISVNATAVRIPVFYGHSESIWFEIEKFANISDIIESLKSFKPILIKDNPAQNIYPLAIDSIKTDMVSVGRIRADLDNPKAFNMWVVGNNIRKGAALNAVQIADYLIRNNLV